MPLLNSGKSSLAKNALSFVARSRVAPKYLSIQEQQTPTQIKGGTPLDVCGDTAWCGCE